MRRRQRPAPEMPPELVKFRPEDWPGEDPAPADWWGRSLEDRWVWSSIQAYRRFQRARREWLAAHSEPGIIATFTDEAEYRHRLLRSRGEELTPIGDRTAQIQAPPTGPALGRRHE